MIKKIWFIGCVLFSLSFTLQSCQFSTDYKKAAPAISKELDNIEILSNKLKESYEKHKAGELTTEELHVLTLEIRDSIQKSKDAVMDLKEDSVGWGSMIMATLAALLSRGIPSKGPLALLFNAFTARRKE